MPGEGEGGERGAQREVSRALALLEEIASGESGPEREWRCQLCWPYGAYALPKYGKMKRKLSCLTDLPADVQAGEEEGGEGPAHDGGRGGWAGGHALEESAAAEAQQQQPQQHDFRSLLLQQQEVEPATGMVPSDARATSGGMHAHQQPAMGQGYISAAYSMPRAPGADLLCGEPFRG